MKNPVWHSPPVRLRTGWWLALCLLASLVGPLPIQAQTNITLTAIPPRLGENFQLTGAPGDTIQTSIQVVNETSQPVPIQTEVEDFIVDEDGSTPIPIQEETSSRWSLKNWLTVSPSTQVIQPGQAATINLIITVPPDALPGGHYAMIMHSPSLDQPGQGATQSRTNQRVGTLVYFVVEGPINEEAFVRNFEWPFFTEYGPVPYSFIIENVSDIHISPQVGIEITNWLGQPVDELVVESRNIFPFVPREIQGQWDRQLGIGWYQATLTMSYGQGGQIAVARTGFWLFPLRLILAGLFGLLVGLALVIWFRRTVVKRNQANKQRIKALETELKKRSS